MTDLLEESFVEHCLVSEESVNTSHTRITYSLHVRRSPAKKKRLMNSGTFESAVLAKTTDQGGPGWVGTRLGSLHSDTHQVGNRVSVHQVSLIDKEFGKVVAQVQAWKKNCF